MATPSKIPATVAEIIPHGAETYSVLLVPQQRMPRFKPGQFLHLALDPYDPSRHWPDSRVFSIASPPDVLPVRLLYSVVGRYTRRMEQELKPGKAVWLKLPYGEFVINAQRETVLVAGGTGVSAFTAFLGTLPGLATAAPITLLYGARIPALLVCRDLLEGWRAAAPALAIHYYSETEADGNTIACGRLSCQAAFNAACDPQQALFYFSGPPAMLQYFTEQMHKAHGIARERLRIDAWE